jgi:cytochrome P450
MTEVEPVYNPLVRGFAEDPYPHYAALRDGDPVHQNPFGVWMVSRYDDVRSLLRDPALSVEDRHMHPTPLTEIAKQAMGDAADMGSRSMLNLDPPAHTRLRRLVSRAFTPRTVEGLRHRVEQLVDNRLDVAERDGGLELMDDLAFPLPFTVISELLGMPPTDRTELRRLSGLVVRSLEPVADAAMLQAIAAAARELRVVINNAIEWKRTRLGDDLLSALIVAEDGEGPLTDQELVEQVSLLYLAGHETTVNLIGNAVLALLRYPDQLGLLRANPGLDGAAVDEFLRFDSPVQMSRRIPLKEYPIGEKTIEAGAFIVLGLASANRDPRKWGTSAGRLELRRPNAAEHVSFGGGHHHCLGAALARLEGQVAVGRLVRRFGQIELSGEPVYNGRLNLRGLASLPLAVAAGVCSPLVR